MKSKKHDVLVLNKGYVPVHIISWQKCMSLLFQEAARPLDRDFLCYTLEDWLDFSQLTNTYNVIHTVRHQVAIPEIIVLRQYNRLPIRDVKYSRQTLFQRDNFRCGYCGELFDRTTLTVDHILPKSKGGTTNWSNTVSSCKPCNMKKADRTPDEAEMKLLSKPRKPVWIGPLTHIKPTHPCKSWLKFMDRPLVDADVE